MISLGIKLEEPLWPDLADRQAEVLTDVTNLEVGALEGGMESGKPSVAIRIDLADGRSVVAESSLALFLAAADALKARFGDPRQPPSVPGPPA